MRAHKYRFWDYNDKKMYYLDYFGNLWNLFKHYENYAGELLEWTGLQDKGDKDIYEGDIIKTEVLFTKETIIREVKFIDGCFCIKEEGCSLPMNEWGREKDEIEFKVIGNKFETPELLKEERDNEKRQEGVK